VPDADALSLEFTHFLRFANVGSFTDKAGLLYWDATDDELNDPQWRQLAATPACAPGGSGWTGTDADDTPSANWETRTVDLCEALEDADGELWLAFYWNTYCTVPLTGAETACLNSAEREAVWFIDDITITSTTGGESRVLFDTDFEPPFTDASAMLVVGRGVDHDLDDDAPVPALVLRPLDDFVRAGGGVLALEPGSPGDLLASIGLEAVAVNPGPAFLEEPGASIVRNPNALPATNASYQVGNVGWSASPASALGPPDEALTFVHASGSIGTLVSGRPFEGGGWVRAVAYDLASWQEAGLADALVENLVAAGSVAALGEQRVGPEAPPDAVAAFAHVRRLVTTTSADGSWLVPVAVDLETWRVEQG
jgi:hypothetical protein